MQREIQLTADGSHTIYLPAIDITYHSRHGAIQESMHVFINAGLQILMDPPIANPIQILEIGFGTGLNALLSQQMANKLHAPVAYTSIEPFPLSTEEVNTINHGRLLEMDKAFQQLHACPWEQPVQIDAYFSLKKINASLPGFTTTGRYHCIYFDVFAPTVQPELWTTTVFEQLLSFLHPGGSLLTYCSKSVVRHAMMAAGFNVNKIPGPYGKREMVKAVKPENNK